MNVEADFLFANRVSQESKNNSGIEFGVKSCQVFIIFFQPASLAQQKTPNTACIGYWGLRFARAARFASSISRTRGFEFFSPKQSPRLPQRTPQGYPQGASRRKPLALYFVNRRFK